VFSKIERVVEEKPGYLVTHVDVTLSDGFRFTYRRPPVIPGQVWEEVLKRRATNALSESPTEKEVVQSRFAQAGEGAYRF
jgi:hypothetical protein